MTASHRAEAAGSTVPRIPARRGPLVAVQYTPRQLATVPERCAAAATAGLDALFFADGVSISRSAQTLQSADGLGALAVAATSKPRIDLGICATSPALRAPEIIANAAASAAAAAPDRLIRLCLGAGDTPVYVTGRLPARLADLRAACRIMRSMWHGGDVGLARSLWRIPNCRVLVTANRPRTLRLAGAVADGVVIGTGLRPTDVAWALEHVHAGMREREHALVDEFEVWVNGIVDIDDDPDAARLRARNRLLTRANHNLRGNPDLIPDDAREEVDTFKARYDEGDLGLGSRNVDLVGPYVAERFSIAGSVADCAARIATLCEAPVTGFVAAVNNWIPDRELQMIAGMAAVADTIGRQRR